MYYVLDARLSNYSTPKCPGREVPLTAGAEMGSDQSGSLADSPEACGAEPVRSGRGTQAMPHAHQPAFPTAALRWGPRERGAVAVTSPAPNVF